MADFDRLMTGTLESSAPYDRGAARLLAQTAFLTATFQAFEQAVADVAGVDEHGMRALALASPRPLYRQLIVTVADQAADRRGLWTADFDLFARMPGVEAIDVVATEALLQSGYYQRLHDSVFPGIEDPPSLLRSFGETARCWSCRTRSRRRDRAVVRLPRS